MKHCEEYAVLLSAFADGEVTQQEHQEVLCHLERCEGCREYLADIMAAKEEVACPVPQLPEDFSDQVMWRVKREKSKKAKKSRRVMTAVASAAACLVLVMALPYVLGGVGADDTAAESITIEDSAADEMAAEDGLLHDAAESVADGGTNAVADDCTTPAAGKTEGNALAVSREQMDAWLAENENMTFRAEETEEETVYYLDLQQYESFCAFMQEQGVFMGEMDENETITVYVR
ncbi:MAG: zf-HC2 domain-containing protein [Oscillospiraceae bacterium]|nr:zf-HC2 domain-containing protein [Oscillospiraceae bacterium]